MRRRTRRVSLILKTGKVVGAMAPLGPRAATRLMRSVLSGDVRVNQRRRVGAPRPLERPAELPLVGGAEHVDAGGTRSAGDVAGAGVIQRDGDDGRAEPRRRGPLASHG